MEHVVNGSFDKYLSDPTILTWSQRLHICFGAALAMQYWNDDIDGIGLFTKGFKILLNKDWEAKVLFVTGARPWYETKNATLGWILLEVLYGRKVTIDDVNQYVAKMGQDHYEEGPISACGNDLINKVVYLPYLISSEVLRKLLRFNGNMKIFYGWKSLHA
ncbi:hypothetical protein QVD17_03261 [Tagetes erecta]|uniref:Uncharacterized protein n=1 Tax=Tagetes erecta TaxID=13708 RepID=A0AAD8LH73_TARER|nr:hypothetical protein QVD17_03261 [Tagetes erecta]